MTNLNHMQNYIGVDVASKKLDIYCPRRQKYWKIPNTTNAIQTWLNKNSLEKSFVVMEHTGGYERPLAILLDEQETPFHFAHPNKAYYFSKSLGNKAKTDKIDARMLSLYGTHFTPKKSRLPSELEMKLRAFVQRRQQLSQMLVQEKNRLSMITDKEILVFVSDHIAQLSGEIKLMEKKMLSIVRNDTDLNRKYELLRSLKGVGIITAITLLADLPEIGEISRNEICALVGVAPYNRDSGTKSGIRRIHGGRFAVRKVLYMAALSGICSNQVIRPYYEKLKKRGKTHKMAIVAAMRKMLITLHAMLRENKPWKFAPPA